MPAFKRQPTKSLERKFFTDIRDRIPLPDLIEAQKESYKWFFDGGMKELFEEVSPITDFTGRDLELYFEDYFIDDPKFDEVTCREKNITFEAPLRVVARLVNKRTKKEDKQEIYLGDIPVMTDRGTFVVNGIERVVVSQLIRSPGAFFTAESVRGRRYYGSKIIPNRGAWIEVETDQNNVIWIKVDRKRKVAATSLLRAFGMSTDEEILKAFVDVDIHPNIKYIENTLEKDIATNEDDGLIEVYKRIRPGDLATADNARGLIHAMFFNFERYDLGKVGVYKFNTKFKLGLDEKGFDSKEQRVLSPEKLVNVLKEVVRLNVSQDEPDDIDHLGNRRVRSVGELVQNRFRVGMARMERIVKDRMSTYDIESLNPNKLINARPVIGAVREFFMSSQLSQFMDQINPLAELEHKRRISALGPGGLSRDRAGFEVRDVHTTHYGRICPIATPEGPNIGLVGHLSTFAKVNSFGFVETPYRKVIHDVPNEARFSKDEIARVDVSGIVKVGEKITAEIAKKLEAKKDLKTIAVKARATNEIVYLNSFEEERVVTASATTPMNENAILSGVRVPARVGGQPTIVEVDKIDYLDIASNQILSVATSLIPFLEHDDATRALMGTNMQRQAVPCINPDSPIVGTGIEGKAAQNSGHAILAKRDGKVTAVDGNKIEITSHGKTDVYRMNKFIRSNASSSINQRPLVKLDDSVKKGDVLCDGPSIQNGELALGQNVLVAYMVWDGYNYEDAIIVSERLVQNDNYTSVHIEDYATDVRETKLGSEVVTSDIPNVSEEKLKNLDSEGVVRVGAEVHSGDILVGKITPKGETELTSEERLLRAIFGEKARDVRDSSLYLEHGEQGKVINIEVFTTESGDKLQPGVMKQVQVTVADLRKIQVGDKMAGRHGNKGVISRVVPVEDMPFLEDGTPVDIILSPLGVVSRMNLGQLLETHLGLAANALGYKVATPALNGITESQIKEELKKAGMPTDGKVQLYDGRTGESFAHKTTVGYNYMLKLNHMVEDKIHQRSIGSYSLITQQPLGGKAQFGGQRFGEMEVWALEAYGAAHTLQEILTIKSDDVPGRSKAYEAIIKGERITKVNLPESFNVLVRELKGLCLDVKLLSKVDNGNYVSTEELRAEKQKEKDERDAVEGRIEE
ncbi:MAG: DNA-directed RNA polymerase subunit beta [Candidatus Magasanikbacteria bacterium RIFCSPHIGHO2_01_FULL_33_34]|uniref:DNA-directed RNA polymerase subunit beta n=1 Tax=Candidatus Magasanikbacteria bacterium RIFCSPHIGHO2_01_FULL_33_34 TaxID=1798671 RepID=A0A1F6LH70_9BACT|nr:MAG: DNA-directed RNA polymerase subunit beta [Candidatus Magasanikbacteria bacterium RIFCSPHIGHO2_01_FULL_33_34]OGH66093.1 MAG: DNA-directed RNA polymerase subunit beta [Candidatus Magasanikbacteria bacterium RIFCSPHIGHO2_02_FULL_33_17]OGH75939.1 MAG: DNA-directed RNA polymerase subunit beta [Candidatus Magasanikbacteria bacterium RIFCSPLOWO2_01_FULL_33_34]OGH80937.1 MAG: DNA-directed RNA polymerase subunit beta [Candidatus Magasanikbacteria bacterium RIFCSPLOWO2_12_FULL_34_7]